MKNPLIFLALNVAVSAAVAATTALLLSRRPAQESSAPPGEGFTGKRLVCVGAKMYAPDKHGEIVKFIFEEWSFVGGRLSGCAPYGTLDEYGDVTGKMKAR